MAELPFIDRVRNPQNYPNPTKFDKEGRPQTHLLSADIDDKTGNWIVYPKLVIKDGKYVEQSMQDAINSGDSVNFGKDQDSAIEFSKTYKDELNPNFEKYYEDFRVKKAIGGEANNLQAALNLLKNPVPNIIKAPEKKEMPKLIGKGGMLFDYTDPVDVGLTALGFTGVGTATALSLKAARLAQKLKKLETFKKLPLYHGGFLPSKNALKIKGVDVFYASPSYKIAERYNPVNPQNMRLSEKTPKEKYDTNRRPGVFEMQSPNKFAVLDKPDKLFKKDVKDYLTDLKFQQKQIIKDNRENAIQKFNKNGTVPNFNPESKYYLPINKLDDLRNLDFKVKDLTRYLKNPKKYDTTQGLGYGYQTGSGVLDVLKAKNYDAVLTNKAFTRLSSPKKSNLEKIRDADIVSDQVVFLKPMGAKQVSTKPLRREFEDFTTDQYLNDLFKNKDMSKYITKYPEIKNKMTNFKDELKNSPNKYFFGIPNKSTGGEIQSLMDEIGIKPIGETSSFKMAMAVLSPEQKLKKIKLLKKYFDKMSRAESLEKPGAALSDLSDATKLKKGIPYSSTKSIQKELDQLQGSEKLDLNLLARLRKELNI